MAAVFVDLAQVSFSEHFHVIKVTEHNINTLISSLARSQTNYQLSSQHTNFSFNRTSEKMLHNSMNCNSLIHSYWWKSLAEEYQSIQKISSSTWLPCILEIGCRLEIVVKGVVLWRQSLSICPVRVYGCWKRSPVWDHLQWSRVETS